MIIKFIDGMNIQIVDTGQGTSKLLDECEWAAKNMFIPQIVKKPKTIDIWKVKNADMEKLGFIKK